jgi:hypothetical protein
VAFGRGCLRRGYATGEQVIERVTRHPVVLGHTGAVRQCDDVARSQGWLLGGTDRAVESVADKARTRRASVALVASVTLFALTACGGSEEPKAEEKTTSAAPSETTTDAPAAPGNQPDWAKPATGVGEKISTIKAGDITADVYQVGTTKATRNGQFADPDTKKPLIAEGDDIVFVNYVVTNTGDAIDLGASFVNISARYDDWTYLQGMDSIVDSALFEQQKVNSDVLAQGAFKDPSVYTFGKGETYSFGENFRYQKNSPITFEATATPVDAQGDLLHDKRARLRAPARSSTPARSSSCAARAGDLAGGGSAAPPWTE